MVKRKLLGSTPKIPKGTVMVRNNEIKPSLYIAKSKIEPTNSKTERSKERKGKK